MILNDKTELKTTTKNLHQQREKYRRKTGPQVLPVRLWLLISFQALHECSVQIRLNRPVKNICLN